MRELLPPLLWREAWTVPTNCLPVRATSPAPPATLSACRQATAAASL